jgi:hypothetical protein
VAAVFTGPVRGVLDIADADGLWRGIDDGTELGTRLAMPGDLDRDGFDDLILTGFDMSGAGRVFVVGGGIGW